MIIVDTALAKRHAEGNPVRVGLIGAGYMGKAVVLQVAHFTPGMEVVAICNRSLQKAKEAYTEAGITDFKEVTSLAELEERIAKGKYSVTEDPRLIAQANNIEVLLEATGAVEYASKIAFEAIEHKKHVVLMNAELDGTLGPILQVYAEKAGVICTNVDGDQPGIEMNLFRYVKQIGLKPVMCGNIKGLQDNYRTPTTQAGYAKQWGQKPHMVTSFADGTKISFEQAVVANATGMTVGKRGMFGPTVPTGTSIEQMADKYPLDAMISGPGIVDYVVGASPPGGIFVLATEENDRQRHFLKLYKMGDGPLYTFYVPYHICHFEVPITCARAVLLNDAAIKPLGAPTVDVVATAKTDLKAGETIDGIGGYHAFGQCETSAITSEHGLLPMGLAEGCRLIRDVPKDQVLTYADVELPAGRFADKLRKEQDEYFSVVAK